METDTLIQILQWVVPSGGIGTAVGWFWNRKVNQARTRKEVHDTFKKMYEDVSALCLKLQKENNELTENIKELRDNQARTQRAINRLSRAIEAIPLCSYHSQCPVLGELRLSEGVGPDGGEEPGKPEAVARRKGQPKQRGRQPGARNGKPGTAHPGDHEPASGSGIQPAGG